MIHPLSTEYFKNVEPLGQVTSIPGMTKVVEKTIAYVPPFVYSHVTGIVSDTGDEAEGWLITVGGTPKQMLAHPPEFTYSRLLEAAEVSRRLGAQIMGLGAFTKVVGDAGVTVAKQAKLPVTTGQQLQRLGRVVGGARGGTPPRDRRGRRRRHPARQGHGGRCVRGDRVGLRPAPRTRVRRAVARLSGDRQAAPAQAGHRTGPPTRHRPRGDRSVRSVSRRST